MKAVLIYAHKVKIQDRYVLEMTIHQLAKTKQYPDGLKYGLILIDLKTGHKILMDNHHPKGPHIHINEDELPYEFKDEDRLIEDFKSLVFEHMGVKL